MSQSRDEALQMYQSMTGTSLQEAQAILNAFDWNLENAVEAHFNEANRPSVQPPPRTNQPTMPPSQTAPLFPRASSLSSPPRRASPDFFTSLLDTLRRVPGMSVVLGVAARVLSFVLHRFFDVLRILPGPMRGLILAGDETAIASPDGATEADSFILNFEQKYGTTHVPFARASYRETVSQAKSNFKFLLIYLHSPRHAATDDFCRNVLCSQDTINALSDNFLVWGGSVTQQDAFQISNMLGATAYPAIFVLGHIQGSYAVIASHAKDVPLPQSSFLQKIRAVQEQFGIHLTAERLSQEERDMDRRLREEQDRVYQEALARDKKIMEEAAAKQREEDELRRKQEEEEQRKVYREEMRRARQVEKANSLPPEPEKGQPDAIKVLFRLPGGSRRERNFLASSPATEIFDYVDSLEEILCWEEYVLVSNFPKRTYVREDECVDGRTIKDTGIESQTMLFVQEKLDELLS